MPKVKLTSEEIKLIRWWIEVEMSYDETDDEIFEQLKAFDAKMARKDNL